MTIIDCYNCDLGLVLVVIIGPHILKISFEIRFETDFIILKVGEVAFKGGTGFK